MESFRSTSSTKRPTVPALEELLYIRQPILDHGSITLMDYQGDQDFIADAARISYGEGTKKVRKNKGLIRYLIRNHHWTPVEMVSLVFRLELPIFVMRQLIRHRVAKTNEMSGRYSQIPEEFYVPSLDRLAKQSTTNKQGSGEVLDSVEAQRVLSIIKHGARAAFDDYRELSEKYELARELARIGLPQSAYTKIYWKMDLRNLLHFIRLRADSHAQKEIQVYANAMAEIVQRGYPDVWYAFEDYNIRAVTFSAPELAFLNSSDRETDPEGVRKKVGLSKREYEELQGKLGKLEFVV